MGAEETLETHSTGDDRRRFLLFADRPVKPFELLFDLVFVFALTQVSHRLESHLTWEGFGEGVLLIATLWLAWESYAWLGATIDLEEGPVRIAVSVVMAAMLVVAVAVPEAFGDTAVIFAAGYAFVRVMQLVLYGIAGKGESEINIVNLIPPATVGPAIILIGAISGWGPLAAWMAAALLLEYGVMLFMDVSGFPMSPSYFTERHGLIFIVALGEALISVGLGTSELELTASVIAAILLGFGIILAMWWTYFDVNALAGERRLSELDGVAQIRAAQHAYTYLHLPMVTGVIFFSLGVKETLTHPDTTVEGLVAVALCAGPALYLLSQVGFRARLDGTIALPRIFTAGAYVGLLVVADDVTALALLAMATAPAGVLVAYEAWAHRTARQAVRREGEIIWE